MGTKIGAGGLTLPSFSTDPASPAAGQMYYNSTEGIIKHYDGSTWQKMTNKIEVNGGTVTISDGYVYHTFTSSSTFTIDGGTLNIDYAIVAGGGAGGGSDPGLGGGGGGGAGGMIVGSLSGATGGYPIVIGAGGAAIYRSRGNSGGNTTAFGLTAIGGGGGGDGENSSNSTGYSGGSGGGGGYRGYTTQSNYGTGTSGQGNNGGGVQGGSASGGGGGGKSSAGSTNTGSGGGTGGIGGSGYTWYNGITYSAGGQGGASGGITGGANTGRGGDGMYADSTGKNGGSGVVVIRYPVLQKIKRNKIWHIMLKYKKVK